MPSQKKIVKKVCERDAKGKIRCYKITKKGKKGARDDRTVCPLGKKICTCRADRQKRLMKKK